MLIPNSVDVGQACRVRRLLRAVSAGIAVVAGWLVCIGPCSGSLRAQPAATAGSPPASDSEVLLALFQKKGMITDQEAREARDLLARRGSPSEPAKSSPMPAAVSGLRVAADFRARFEENNADDPGYFTRDRYRYRLRLGAVVSFVDRFDIAVRFASGNPLFNPGGTLVGGSPITANQDLNSLESRKFFWIDAAYAKWTPVKTEASTFSAMFGKMDNPFALSTMVWDPDIAPEGGALQLDQKIGQRHALRVSSAFLVLDEINQAVGAVPSVRPARDPFVYGGQASWESKWSRDFETSLGIAAFDLLHKDSLSAKVQPFYNSGNSRDGTTGLLKYRMRPVIGTASATWKAPEFPLYAGPFPIKVSVDYLKNPGAPSENRAYRVGAGLGKAGQKHAWEFNYRYQRLEADAWFDALVDDDNGAFYVAGNPQLAGTGKANGWFGGTNVKGHWVQATYSLTAYLNLTFTGYWNKLIINSPGGKSDAGHFFTDLMWKF